MNSSDLAILWDLDGTIIDSTECHFKTWVAALERQGYSVSWEVFKSHYGRNNKAALPKYLGFDPDPSLAKEICEDKEVLFRQLVAEEAKLVPGITSWLEGSKKIGIRQAIASSASLKNITTMLAAFNLVGFFDLLVSGANLPAKPNPAVFQAAADQLGKSSGNCLVIEDSPAGVEAARRAGMTCIAVTTSHTRSQLKNADLVVDDFYGSFLEALNRLELTHR